SPARVEVIHNRSNVGFPAGCNQGIAQARGAFVVLLNNDTVVTPGWLDGLLAWIVQGWPKVGLVGPVTNASPPPQEIPVDYAELTDVDAFARRRQLAQAGQALK